jgi:hypothetical protein
MPSVPLSSGQDGATAWSIAHSVLCCAVSPGKTSSPWRPGRAALDTGSKEQFREDAALMVRSSPSLHIGLRYIVRRNQGVDASSGQFGAVIAKAVCQKRASDPVFATEIVIVPATFVRYRGSDVWQPNALEGNTQRSQQMRLARRDLSSLVHPFYRTRLSTAWISTQTGPLAYLQIKAMALG